MAISEETGGGRKEREGKGRKEGVGAGGFFFFSSLAN